VGNNTVVCALDGVRYKFGTTEGEKEWLSGSAATPDEALRFFDFVVGIQAVTGELGSIPTAPTKSLMILLTFVHPHSGWVTV